MGINKYPVGPELGHIGGYMSAVSQSIPNNAFTVVVFDTLDMSMGGIGTLNTGTGVITITQPGMYVMLFSVQWAVTASTFQLLSRGEFPAGVTVLTQQIGSDGNSDGLGQNQISNPFQVTPAQISGGSNTAQVRVRQQTGGALNINGSGSPSITSIGLIRIGNISF
jgi:hypothetical protein